MQSEKDKRYNSIKLATEMRRSRMRACGYDQDIRISKADTDDIQVGVLVLCVVEYTIWKCAIDNVQRTQVGSQLSRIVNTSLVVSSDETDEQRKRRLDEFDELLVLCSDATPDERALVRRRAVELAVTHELRTVCVSHLLVLGTYNESVKWETRRLEAFGYSKNVEPMRKALSIKMRPMLNDPSSFERGGLAGDCVVFVSLDALATELADRLCVVDYDADSAGHAWLALEQPEALATVDLLLTYDYLCSIPSAVGCSTWQEVVDTGTMETDFADEYATHCKLRQFTHASRALVPLSFAVGGSLRIRPPLPSLPMACPTNRLFVLMFDVERTDVADMRDKRQRAFIGEGVHCTEWRGGKVVRAYANRVAGHEQPLDVTTHSVLALVDEFLMLVASEYKETGNFYSVTELLAWHHIDNMVKNVDSTIARVFDEYRDRGHQVINAGAEWLLNSVFRAFGGIGMRSMYGELRRPVDSGLFEGSANFDCAYDYLRCVHKYTRHVWFFPPSVSLTKGVAASISDTVNSDESPHYISCVTLCERDNLPDTVSRWHEKSMRSIHMLFAWYSANVDDTYGLRLTADHQLERRFVASDPTDKTHCSLHDEVSVLYTRSPQFDRIRGTECTQCSAVRRKFTESSE